MATWMSALLFIMPAFVHAKSIALIYNKQLPVFVQFAESLATQLPTQGHRLLSIDLNDYATGDDANRFDLIIIAGTDALQRVRYKPPGTPMWVVLTSKDAYQQSEMDLRRGHRTVSAIYHDPPPLRQLALAKQLQPGIRQVGYLYAAGNTKDAEALQEAGKQLGLNIIAMPVSTHADLPATLISVLQRSDVLLANADPQIYNSQTIKTILTAAYRQDKTLIGSSPAFVKAGSLATTYTPIHHIVADVLKWTATLQNNAPVALPLAHYPQEFEVLVKTDVAHSLGLNAPSSEELKKHIQAIDAMPRTSAGGKP